MKPRDLYNEMKRDIIGQDDVLKYVAVAVFKHINSEPFGNIIMIGNSGTGKTSIMNAIERLFNDHPEYDKYRVVVRMNANSLANEEGAVITGKQLFETLQDRATQILGRGAPIEKIKDLIEHATVCIDEIDKITTKLGGRPNVVGINIQQSLLTLMEGEKVLFVTNVFVDGEYRTTQMEINTSNMLFLCGGAFEELYDQVYSRVFEEGKQEKLTQMTRHADGRVFFKQVFTLKDNLTQEDMFKYGMLPQFLSRFDSSLILNDLSIEDLRKIFLEPRNSVFNISKNFFKRLGIELSITEKAIQLVAAQAAEQSRVGARALKDVYGRIVKPFEFDPFETGLVKQLGPSNYELTITERIVRDALGLK